MLSEYLFHLSNLYDINFTIDPAQCEICALLVPYANGVKCSGQKGHFLCDEVTEYFISFHSSTLCYQLNLILQEHVRKQRGRNVIVKDREHQRTNRQRKTEEIDI